MKPEYIITIVISIVTGLIILIYKHPIGGRKLLKIVSIVTTGIFILWAAFSIGESSENLRLNREVRGKNIILSSKNDLNEILIFGLGSMVLGFILVALSHYFEDLHKEKVDKVKD